MMEMQEKSSNRISLDADGTFLECLGLITRFSIEWNESNEFWFYI